MVSNGSGEENALRGRGGGLDAGNMGGENVIHLLSRFKQSPYFNKNKRSRTHLTYAWDAQAHINYPHDAVHVPSIN